MDYKSMSDFEINREVAVILNPNAEYIPEIDDATNFENGNAAQVIIKTGVEGFLFDPCNNPSDAWKIILDNGISINKWHSTDENWTADVEHPMSCDDFNTIEVSDKNPLRAAMICFLLMKDAEQ